MTDLPTSFSPESIAEMQAVFPPDNSTDEERYAARVWLFNHRKLALLTGNAWRLDSSDEQLAFTILDDIVGLAKDGNHAEAVELAAEAKTIVDACERSPSAWKTSATRAFKLLGHTKKRGQRPNRLAIARAVSAYEIHFNAGASIADAERFAYDAYQFELHGRKKAYEEDCQLMVYGGAQFGRLSKVELWMRHTFRRELVSEKLQAKPKRGRKPKAKR